MKFYIIQLNGNVISEKYAGECISQAKKFGYNLEVFDAINGAEYEKHLEILKISPKYKFKKGRAGVYGCFLSHYYLWKQCSKGTEPFVILEHDGFFIKPLPDNVLNLFDDVLKLDPFDPYSSNYNSVLDEHFTNPVNILEYFNTKAKVSKKIGTGNYFRGAYGYIIKPDAASKIVNWIKNNGFVPADQQLGNSIVNLKTCFPGVLRLHPDYFTRVKELSLTGNPELLNPLAHVSPTSTAS